MKWKTYFKNILLEIQNLRIFSDILMKVYCSSLEVQCPPVQRESMALFYRMFGKNEM